MALFDLSLDELQSYRPEVREPDDFDAFWQKTLDEARSAAFETRLLDVDSPLQTLRVQDLTFSGFGGDPIRGWVISPASLEQARPGVVTCIGYGGGRGSVVEHLAWASAGFVNLVMDTRGQGSEWSAGGATPDPHGSGPAFPGVMTRGIESPDTYYYRRLMADAARAVEVTRELHDVDANRVAIAGGSQGGGLALAGGALAKADAVLSDVPFLCHFERAITLVDSHPYKEIGKYLSTHHIDDSAVLDVLSYFDGVNFAKRIDAPALLSVGLMDDTCPPSTVYAAANRLKNCSMNVYKYNGHEGGGTLQIERQLRWLADLWAHAIR